MGAFEDGQKFLDGVLAKLPESLRVSAKDLFTKPEAKDAITLVGDGALARSDYSKHMDELKKLDDAAKAKLADATKLYEDNVGWRKNNEQAITDAVALKARLDAGGNGGGDTDFDEVGIRKLALDEINRAGREYIGVSAWLADKAVEHYAAFNEKLSLAEITSNPKLGKEIAGQPGRVFSLDDAYTEKYGEKVAARVKDVHDKAIEAEVQKRLSEERTKLGGQPFPLRGEIGPSVLDVLTTKEGPAAHTLDTATAEYDRLQAARGV